MTRSPTRTLAAAMLAALVALASTACSSATHGATHQSGPSPESAASPAAADQSESAAMAQARADSIRHPYTKADIDFMTGMISHHAQAIVMSRWAATHGASPSIQTLCARIINAQSDEIRTMQTWLRDRREPVPDPLTADSTAMKEMGGMMMPMNGGSHEMLMPGMLTDEQMKQLDAARGADFDRLFLTFMIQHHRGAISMVKELFGSYGAGQDELVFKLASDINVDQTTEVARMQKMLASLLFENGSETPPAGGRS